MFIFVINMIQYNCKIQIPTSFEESFENLKIPAELLKIGNTKRKTHNPEEKAKTYPEFEEI